MISINSYFPNAYIEVEKYLSNNLKNIINSKRAIIFLCIGTDRSSGDSLGPLIGYKLKSIKNSKFYIYGSLENPIHSLNIEQIIEKIYASFKDPFIIAIDASLGDAKNVGKIFIEKKPLYPGAALNRTLTPIGHISIVGVVNVLSKSEFIILQNTRLYTVMTLADSISQGISSFIDKSLSNNFSNEKM
ncbi:MAG: spore protease YyaC [Clostridium sp.]|nr:spore protease YyaC [Clostridium sp.]